MTARVWDARTGQPVGAPLQHGATVTSAAFSADGTRVVTADDKTARVWDVAAGRSRDAGIIAEAAEALSEYTVNDASSLIRVDNAAVRATSLRQRVAHAEFVEPSATWMLHWFFEDPWDRTVSPLSAITVNDYIIERLKRCTYEARIRGRISLCRSPAAAETQRVLSWSSRTECEQYISLPTTEEIRDPKTRQRMIAICPSGRHASCDNFIVRPIHGVRYRRHGVPFRPPPTFRERDTVTRWRTDCLQRQPRRVQNLYRKCSSGTEGTARSDTGNNVITSDWSTDGMLIVYTTTTSGFSGVDI